MNDALADLSPDTAITDDQALALAEYRDWMVSYHDDTKAAPRRRPSRCRPRKPRLLLAESLRTAHATLSRCLPLLHLRAGAR